MLIILGLTKPLPRVRSAVQVFSFLNETRHGRIAFRKASRGGLHTIR